MTAIGVVESVSIPLGVLAILFNIPLFILAWRVFGLKPLIKTIRRLEYGGATQTHFSQIKIAELGNDAGIIGAAILGL